MLLWILAACASPNQPSGDGGGGLEDGGGTLEDGGGDSGDTGAPPPPEGWYLDCEGGDDAADGRSPETAWRSLDRLAAAPLGPGEDVWLLRGRRCEGTLRLDGQGTRELPLRVGAWGEGAPPIVDAAGAEAAAILDDQSFVELRQLELTGSTRWGLYVGAAAGASQGLRLSDLDIHGVRGSVLDSKGTGLLVFTVEGTEGWFEDVEVEGVTAWDTDLRAGINLYGVAWRSGATRSRGFLVRDSVVYQAAGDGIVAFGAQDVHFEHNLVHELGLAADDRVGTPNGIWTWDCQQCTVQHNEVHHVQSPGLDGGAFDIDWDNVDNLVQYNHGHHNEGYCVTQVYHNSFIRSGGYGYPAFVLRAAPQDQESSGIWNNLVLMPGDWVATVVPGVELGDNLYFSATVGSAWFDDDQDGWWDGLWAWQATGRDAGSQWADPLLVGDGAGGAEDLQLAAGSPAIDRARPLAEDGGCDAFGGALAGTRVQGAHELGAAKNPGCAP